FSFSGLKTSFLYFLRDQVKVNPNFIEENKNDLAASIQKCIIDILLDKLVKASEQTGIKSVAIAGGVSANSGMRERTVLEGKKRNWNVYVPKRKFTTDNAAMIAITGYYKYLSNEFSNLNQTPFARIKS
ncbi:MAG: tRNA (adenosine(37)-N6)-threonylcarbamoyltransferase complex transferase subunit TsaD, partial [Bacteroidales bacterium]|nr:tRNA (adenosine(37)-N6)-threonylcarbamoyltransferase complex transferase subunit TsaD [Bacteroidales bacterium]